MTPLKKGERLPVHKYKQYWAMSGRYRDDTPKTYYIFFNR